jgi:hypothetical protein
MAGSEFYIETKNDGEQGTMNKAFDTISRNLKNFLNN